MQRTVSARMEIDLTGTSDLIFSMAPAVPASMVEETFSFVVDGSGVEAEELVDRHGTRLHVLEAGPGRMLVEYQAVVTGRLAPATVDPIDAILYTRPSRYCESDSLSPTARAEFAGLSGHALLAAVRAWVGERLAYVPGSSLPTDGAARTLMARRGVCRDYAHLVIALLRALDVPARMVGVYAPGLSPMDFHAVAEALVDGEWWVVDATGLAPRQSLLRIATGRDAADIAFLTNHRADLTLRSLQVMATVDEFSVDEPGALVRLG